MTYNFTAAVQRALGDTDRPLKIMLLSGLVNLVLNIIFVACFRMDVAGVALATVLSNYLSAFLVLRLLTRSDGHLKLRLKNMGLHWPSMLEILRIGLPAGINSTLYNLANVTIQSAVNTLGPIAMAGNAAAASADSLIHTAITAFYNAAPSFTSQNLGAKRYDRIPRVLLWNMAYSGIIGLSLGILARVFGTSLLGLYVPVDDPNRAAVIADGLIRLTWVALPCFICGVMDVCCGVLRGLGRNWIPLAVSILGGCGLRIVWVKTAFSAAPSLQRLYLCYPLSWICVLLVYLFILIPVLYKLKIQTSLSPCNQRSVSHDKKI
jgi:Na+-driven multidrug efflux pump